MLTVAMLRFTQVLHSRSYNPIEPLKKLQKCSVTALIVLEGLLSAAKPITLITKTSKTKKSQDRGTLTVRDCFGRGWKMRKDDDHRDGALLTQLNFLYQIEPSVVVGLKMKPNFYTLGTFSQPCSKESGRNT